MSNNRKMWWDLFNESMKTEKVIGFMEQMKEMGAAGGPRTTSFAYHKNDLVLVANYRPCDNKIIGTIMTDDAYSEFRYDARESMETIPDGYFAWAYGYGWDFAANGLDPVTAFKLACDGKANFALMNRTGNFLRTVSYMVIEYQDTLPKGECGVCDEWNLVGIFADVRAAENVCGNILKTQHDCRERYVDIVPVFMNHEYKDKMTIASSIHIE